MSVFTGCQVDSNEDEKATYTVTYNANGGSGEMKAQTAEEGTEITLTANAFTKEGYTFSGWNTAVDGKGTDYADKSTIKLTVETALYAKWNPNAYKVMFCNDSGNADDVIIETTYDTEFALPETTTMSKTGYNFYGWNTEPDGSGKNFKPGEKVKNLTTETGTVTLYVRWLEKGAHTITYVLNGGTNDESNPEIFLERNAIELKDPSRTFYEFTGWYDNAELSGEKLTGWNAGEKTGDITLYAKWTITQTSISAAIKAGITEIKLTGKISEDEIGAIRSALYENSDARINLDISGTTGLTEIPENAFRNSTNLEKIVLPKTITSIGMYAFSLCEKLTEIIIPDSVKTIDKQAFNQSGLTSIKFGSGLESIGRFAFQACNLTKITVPGNVKAIMHGAFDSCVNLEEVVLEEGVQTIGENAFSICEKLATVTISKSVTFIGKETFYYCDALQTVNYGGTTAEWNALKASIGTDNDVLLNATVYCTDGIVITADKSAELITSLEKSEYNIAVTGAITNDTISAIKTALQSNENAKVNLDLSQTTGLTSIGNETFSNCDNLTSVNIPASVTSIGKYAFMYCSSLTSVNIPDSVTSIAEAAFMQSGLTSITIPSGVTSISSYMFKWCGNLKSVVIPASVTSIGENVFTASGLTTVNYKGSEEQWNKITIADNNSKLTNATKEYNYTGE